MHRITLNMNVAEPRDPNLAKQFVTESKSDWVYFLNPDPEWIRVALFAGKKVVARIYDPFGDARIGSFDNAFHTLRTPLETFRWFKASAFAEFQFLDVFFIIGMNEPSANSSEDIAKGIHWAVDFGKLMVDDGYKVDLGGWNITKSIRMFALSDGAVACPDVDLGIWDPLLKFAHDNSRDVVVDIHVYTVGRAWGQLVAGFPMNRVTMNNPPSEILWLSRLNGEYRPYYHFAREQALYIRMQEKGWFDVRFGIGECIWDNMADISSQVAIMRRAFGRPEFMHDMRGIRSLRNYYAYLAGFSLEEYSLYTDEAFGRDAFTDLKWMDLVYPNNVVYMAIFAWNTNQMWEAYDISHPEMRHLVALIKDQLETFPDNLFSEAESPFPIPPVNGWVESDLVLKVSGLNFRKSPSGEILFTLKRSQEVLSFDLQYPHDGYIWQLIQVNGQTGWIALEQLTPSKVFAVLSPVVVNPIPPEIPSIEDKLITFFIRKGVFVVILLILLLLSIVSKQVGLDFHVDDYIATVEHIITAPELTQIPD